MPSSLPGLVIAVYNEAANLKRCLPQLIDLFEEIVVVDNHSRDESATICQQFPVQLIQPPPRRRWTRGQCWNEGAKYITSESVLFLHVDTEIPQTSVEELQQVWQSEACDYTCFRIRFPTDAVKYRGLETISNFRSQHLQIVYGDQGFCIRKTVFDAIGGFPNEYLLEDLKINRLLRSYRFRFIEAPVYPSIRKFEKIGFYRYLFLMNRVLWLNFRGVPTKDIYQLYYGKPK